MPIDERTKRENKRKRKQYVSIIKAAAMFVLCIVGLFFMLNDKVWHIGGMPTSEDVIRFFGGGAKPYVKLSNGEASVSFIDVGQGDCELIRTDKYNILIDSGDDDRKDDVVGFLKYSGVERLDMVIVTHPHSDHCGGMYHVLRSFDVGLFIMPELPLDLIPQGVFYKRMLAEIDDRNICARCAKAGEVFDLGDDCRLEIMTPLYYDYDELNDYSITVKFVHGKNSFLFTGDLQKFSELDLVESGADIDVDVLKVGHHGSAGSSCEEFLNKVTPEVAVFETAEYNYYSHPRVDVIERLVAVGCNTTYSTANNGNIVMISDKTNIHVVTEKEKALVLSN